MRSDYNELDVGKKILITGGVGFIGYSLSAELLKGGLDVVGFDDINDYYEIELKYARLRKLEHFQNYFFQKGDMSNKLELENCFKEHNPQIIVNLGAQAGIRYSIENPEIYMKSNIIGFFNLVECCRRYPVEHLIYASSSSVYGANKKIPFATNDKVDKPVSFYAATKKSNELMAYSYSKLYEIPSTGLRFFTVYGPFGRPDMAYYSFARKIVNKEIIKVYNNGDMYRDFTYIDDIVEGIARLLCNPPAKDENEVRHKIYNIGNNRPIKLMDFINILEQCIGIEAKKEFLPMQLGDVYQTYADVTDLMMDIGFKPETQISEGIQKFVDWFFDYYKVDNI